MVEETNVNLDTENEDLDELEELETTEEESENDSDEVTALKDKNRHLYARAKKGEGFEQVDGKWVKKEEKTEVKPEIKLEEKPEVKPEQVTGLTSEDVSAQVTATLEQRDLDAEDISDELKEEVKDYAKLKGVSVKKALDSQYIKHQLALEKGEDLADNASIGSGTRKATTNIFSEPGTFDHSTDKGKEDFKKWEEKQREELG